MRCDYVYSDLGPDDWEALRDDLDPKHHSRLIEGLLEAFREAGAVLFLEESTYIDRDFSAAYAAFYSTLYYQRPKHCRRLHFFSSPLQRVWDAADPADLAAQLSQEGYGTYLGYIVVRPLAHAPVSRALLSSRHGAPQGAEIAIRSVYTVHVLGAELQVEGVPITEQDTLTGSCAQATIWVAARHFQNRHAMPWFSVVDITEAAVKPTDSILSKALPAGSESLSADNIVRALRAMGEHPVVYKKSHEDEWDVPPDRTIAQYLDSGIPVIVGLARGEGVGHAVVAVGTVADPDRRPGDAGDEPAPSDRNGQIVVHDDQRGPYQLLSVDGQDASHGEDIGYSLDDAIFLIVPLPPKVYLKAEIAEAIARDKVETIITHRDQVVKLGKKDAAAWSVDPSFYELRPSALLARTYLTAGWKYKHRMLRNTVSPALLEEVNAIHLPRYVWVTEFSLPQDQVSADPWNQAVRGHVLIDATGNRFDDTAVLLVHLPGILIGEHLDVTKPADADITRLRVLAEDRPYLPKVRGSRDFNACERVEANTGPQPTL